MSQPRVSVIIPVRDRAVLLQQTLAGLDGQRFRDFEVIVVDDGSTDGSGEVAAERGAVLLRTGGAGAVAARIAGVAQARGEILAFTDSDCIPDPEWLAAGVAAVDAGADVVQGLTRPARPARALERTVWAGDDGLYATCNVFYRRSVYDSCGGFQAGPPLGFRPGRRLRGLGFGEDTMLGWRVRRRGKAAFAPDAVVVHHVFGPDLMESLRRAWTMGAFPGLIRQVPELRESMRSGLAAGRRERLPLYGLALAMIGSRRRWRVLCGAWWVVSRYRAVRRLEPSAGHAVAVLPVDLAVQAISTAALVAGSVRSRQVVL